MTPDSTAKSSVPNRDELTRVQASGIKPGSVMGYTIKSKICKVFGMTCYGR